MQKRKFIFFNSIIVGFIFVFGAIFLTQNVLAEESVAVANEAISAEAAMDSNINPEDLGVEKARILPDNPLYGFKNFFRKVQETVTLDPVEKAELRLKFANEKIVEAKQLVEDKATEKAKKAAAKAIEGANNDFKKIANQGEKLKAVEGVNRENVDKFLNKVADQSLKQQIVIQKLQEQVSEDVFAKIESARREHLEKFGEVMSKVAENKEKIASMLSEVVESQEGSDFRELKMVEILKDLENSVPQEQKGALSSAQKTISLKFEEKLNNMTDEKRQRISQYVESMPGNAVRQFEALDSMRQNFQSQEAVQQMEIAKDAAIGKFEEQFSGLQNEGARADFMEPWTNGDPQGLRVITEMKMRMEPVSAKTGATQESVDSSLKIFNSLEGSEKTAQNNFKEKLRANAENLKQDPVLQKMISRPDVVDLKMTQDLTQAEEGEAFSPTDQLLKDFQKQTTEKFIQNTESVKGQSQLNPRMFGPPVPAGLKILEEIKGQVSPQAQKGIDKAIQAQTKTMESHIERINNLETLNKYKQQIEEDKTIRQKVQQYGAPTFFNKMEERSREMKAVQSSSQVAPSSAKENQQGQTPQQIQPSLDQARPLPNTEPVSNELQQSKMEEAKNSENRLSQPFQPLKEIKESLPKIQILPFSQAKPETGGQQAPQSNLQPQINSQLQVNPQIKR